MRLDAGDCETSFIVVAVFMSLVFYAGAVRNLELFESSTLGSRATLFAHIDRTRSSAGSVTRHRSETQTFFSLNKNVFFFCLCRSRQLRRWLAAPLFDAKHIALRLDAVALLRPGTDRTQCLGPLLAFLGSVEIASATGYFQMLSSSDVVFFLCKQ